MMGSQRKVKVPWRVVEGGGGRGGSGMDCQKRTEAENGGVELVDEVLHNGR